jgi:hypothetical protein
VRLVAIAVLLVSFAAAAREPVRPFADELDPLWKATGKPDAPAPPGVSWRYSLTPPLPAAWPLEADGTVVTYVYASGFDAQLRDGERIAAPWARIDQRRGVKARVSRLAGRLEIVGVQGVRPITRDEAALQQKAFDTADALRRGQLDALAGPWCAWLRAHGTIADRLRPLHPAFFGALPCQPAR